MAPGPRPLRPHDEGADDGHRADWVLERALETALVTPMFTFAFHPLGHLHESLARELLATAIFPLLFYLVSAYVLTCLVIGVWLRTPVVRQHVLRMTLGYQLHCLTLLMPAVGWDLFRSFDGFVCVVGGGVAVAIANFVGATLLLRCAPGAPASDGTGG